MEHQALSDNIASATWSLPGAQEYKDDIPLPKFMQGWSSSSAGMQPQALTYAPSPATPAPATPQPQAQPQPLVSDEVLAKAENMVSTLSLV